jgi:hypothetical protein
LLQQRGSSCAPSLPAVLCSERWEPIIDYRNDILQYD